MSFIHLHVYSAYSLLMSTVKVEDLARQAKQLGFEAIALTDRNVMYGAVSFYKECLKNEIKPILGLTADVINDESDQQEPFPLVLLARNQTGYQNLLKISSVIGTKSPNGIPARWLKAYSEGLIMLSSGLEGKIEQHLMQDEYDAAKATAVFYRDLCEDQQFYLSLHDHGIAAEEKVRNGLIQIGSETGIELAAANAVHYLQKEDAFAQDCLTCIKTGEKIQSEDRTRLQGEEYNLKSAAEMTGLLSMFPDALENTLKIAEKCNVMLELNGEHLPKYPSENGLSSEQLLDRLCWQGYRERYPHDTKVHKDRLTYELSILKKMKYSDYFLIVYDFMKYCREQDILTGPGRGSAAGSMVAYVLYITDVDPIAHGLLFERFLNPERISMPDIDIDFPDHRRDEVIQYVANKYGEMHVAQIVTFGTMAAKAALRDVGRAFGLNTKELDRLSKSVPSKLGITLQEAYHQSESLRRFTEESGMNKRLFETALKLEGLPRHTSTHAAGVVISEMPLVSVVPIQSGHDQVYLTQYSMEYLENIGLLKMDFLGLRNLSLIENIVSSITKSRKEGLNIKSIPLDNDKVFKLLSSGKTNGIFQFESAGMQRVLKNLRPSSFEDIVAVNALYRPGPMENIPLFIDRKHGKQEISYYHPDLKPILENTYGVIVYQEQIMQIAAVMAGFTLGEADMLRRAVSKKQKAVLDQEREHFVAGALKKGYSEQTAHNIYDLIVKFANYGFNRSHAVAYSLIAYQLAYLKSHYPLHFMAALLTSSAGNEVKISQYIRELKEMDLAVLPPSINKSWYTFTVEQNAVRYSLGAIKGVGGNILKEIFKARSQQKFHDLFDFCLRVSSKIANRKIIETLIHSGSFDEFGEDRAILLASIDAAMEHALLVKPDEDQGDFFSDGDFFPKPKYTIVDPITADAKLAFEKEVLGLYLSDHPVSVYEEQQKRMETDLIAELDLSSRQVRLFVFTAELNKIRTKKGSTMAFVTLSDQSGEVEGVIFPEALNQYSHLLSKGRILFLTGKPEEREGKKQIIVQTIQPPEQAIATYKEKEPILYLKIPKEQETNEQLRQLKQLFKDHSGDTSVILYYESSGKRMRLGEEDCIHPTQSFLDRLKGLLGRENVILKR
ncbi:DNA polymerase III subunit alpha [Cytobacillus gottheilii]|uniref:DNA polymerase III subunit alpha n=1 Tax=Cytobacillus gottheilii TaxID=859144 RepID=UPI0009BC717E|nr:DNA polymerase III subunit alpha [Cytobacillus gottheilii]